MGWYHSPDFQGFDSIPATAPAAAEEPIPSSTTGETACPLPDDSPPLPPPPDAEFVYHLCRKELWDAAKTQELPYFPPTFLKDGKFTRCSLVPTCLRSGNRNWQPILQTANTFYGDVSDPEEEWILLEINCPYLFRLGIPILAAAAPEDSSIQCLQVFGGISTVAPGLVKAIYPLERHVMSGRFLQVLERTAIDLSLIHI